MSEESVSMEGAAKSASQAKLRHEKGRKKIDNANPKPQKTCQEMNRDSDVEGWTPRVF